jgi:Sec-independent protein translocase protein TatA
MELSFFEVVLVGIIAFLVLGPTEMVRFSHKLGRWVGKLKTEARNFRILAEEQILNAEKKAQEQVNDIKKLVEPEKIQNTLNHRTDLHEVLNPAVMLHEDAEKSQELKQSLTQRFLSPESLAGENKKIEQSAAETTATESNATIENLSTEKVTEPVVMPKDPYSKDLN